MVIIIPCEHMFNSDARGDIQNDNFFAMDILDQNDADMAQMIPVYGYSRIYG